EDNPLFLDLRFDWHLLAFTAAIATLTCILFGVTPALRATRIAPAASMKTSGRGLTAGRERLSLRRGLIVLQVALSLVLVAGALLFSRSLNKLLHVEAGFRPEGILLTQTGFTRLNLPPEQSLSLRQEMLEHLKAIPGVDAIAEASLVPLGGSSTNN